MATISPSPNTTPFGVPPTVSPTPPQPSVDPPVSPSNPIIQPNATPPETANPPPPSQPNGPPPSNSPHPTNSPPPILSSPPPVASAPPPSVPLSPPPTSVTPQTPPPVTSPPPTPSVSQPPPQTTPPPVGSPPPVNASAPSPPASPPSVVPTPPGSSTPPPTSPPPPGSRPPPTSPSPPSAEPPSSPPPAPPVSPNPPTESPPPPSAKPPETPPSPPGSTPPEKSPTPPGSQPPGISPSPPAVKPPGKSPPSDSAPPPSAIPGTPTPAFQQSPPSPGSRTVAPSPPGAAGNKSDSGAQTTNGAPSKGGIGSGGAVAIGIIAGVLILGLLCLVAFWMLKRKKRTSGANDGHILPASIGSSPRSDIKLLVKTENPGSHFGGGSGTDTPTEHGGYGQSRSWFTYNELSEATGGFSNENLLGEGGFGCVYKGILPDGRVVAVKQLKIGGGQGDREFRAEVEIIGRIHHRHLVSLVGYCIWESRRLLVYDYVSNDTLHFHLHGGGRPVMDWATRLKIAAGAARGIAYLHEDCHPRIIHRDIKSSNILLDHNFEAQVSDFGLAKLALDADTHVSTRVMGTFGYLAPEYATTGKLTEKSDVYSFGVVLLELLTGRKPVDESQPLGDESLVEWARPLLSRALDMGEFEAVVDARLEKNYIESEMFRMIEAAAACVRHSASKRPRMGQVVRALSLSDSGDLSNGLRVGESQLYDSAQQSAEIRWFRRMAFGSQDSGSDMFSRNSQNLGFSTQSRPNANFSASHGQGGDPSRQRSQDSVNPGIQRQSEINISISSERGLSSSNSRQQGHITHHST